MSSSASILPQSQSTTISGGEFNNSAGGQSRVVVNCNIHVDQGAQINSGNESTLTASQNPLTPSGDLGQVPPPNSGTQPPSVNPEAQASTLTEERESPNARYERHLLAEGHGFPLWVPQPHRQLPLSYRRKGVSIGDVGIITREGCFDFLFNICLPRADPGNPEFLPMNFSHVYLSPTDFSQWPEHDPGGCFLTPSTKKLTRLTFNCSGPEGSILVMPNGAYHEDLRNLRKFRTTAAHNAENWYRFAMGTCGREIGNGKLHLVTGCDKTNSWGIATYSDPRPGSLTLTPNNVESHVEYTWDYEGRVEAKAGPRLDESLDAAGSQEYARDIRNQCTFLRSFTVTLGNEKWKSMLSTLTEDSSENHLLNSPESQSYFPSIVSGLFWGFGGRGGSVNLRNHSLGSEKSTTHPAMAINQMLLSGCPDAKVAISHDDDWCAVIREDEITMPDTSELLNRIRQVFVPRFDEDGTVYLSQKHAPEAKPPWKSLASDGLVAVPEYGCAQEALSDATSNTDSEEGEGAVRLNTRPYDWPKTSAPTNTAGRRPSGRILPLKKATGPDFSAEKTWSELSKNLREIQNHTASNLSFQENYGFAYDMVIHRQGEMLYKGVNQLVTENLEKLAKEQVIPKLPAGTINDAAQQSLAGELLLKSLRNVWDDHISNMRKLGQILRYMDVVYIKTVDVPETWPKGLELFLKHVIKSPIKEHLITAILKQVQYERDGYVINRSAVKGCVDVFLSLDVDPDGSTTVYKVDFEPLFLKESESFYKAEADYLLSTCDASEYLHRVDAYFVSEDSRIHHYLSRQTSPLLKQILGDHLLAPISNSGLDVMIDTDKIQDLARLYGLYKMVPDGLLYLGRLLKGSITRRGKEINNTSLGADTIDVNVEGDGDSSAKSQDRGNARAWPPNSSTLAAFTWVRDVLALKDKFDSVWKRAFDSDQEVESSLNEAFGSFVNMNKKSSEFISLFIDNNLKRGLKGKTENEVDVVLDKTITVFRFISEKDVFERYYKGHLAKRLLLGRSVSDDAEHGMLAKLKVECGYQFTQKLGGMFHDIKLSADTMQAYQDHLSKTTAPEIDINVTVLTSTFWPVAHSTSPCNLSAEMGKACKSFEQFYLSRYPGRRLTWQLSLGNAAVRVKFKARTHEINVSTFALIILLLFEDLSDDEFLTYGDIKDATSIEDVELKRHLQSLACAKFKILKKYPAGCDVLDNDSFSFNSGFTLSNQKVKINTISSKVESSEERRETLDRINEARKHQMEACIVRIMKDRKHLSHNDLINEVTEQLLSRFRPEPLAIKRRIENLIEREYLERCEDHISYSYLA